MYGKALAIVTMVAAMSAPVAAADLLEVPVSTDAALPVADGFDWNGFYAGIYGVSQNSADTGSQYGLGLAIGAEARFDYVLVGGEVAVEGLLGGTDEAGYVEATARAGVALTDNLVAYAAAGLGTDIEGNGGSDALVGGGLELAVSDSVSLDARYLHGFDLGGGDPTDQFSLGAKFHF